MRSRRQYPSKTCFNPRCKVEFTPHDRRQIFCSHQCRVNFFNDKKHEENTERFFRQDELKRADRLLEALLDSEFYKDNRIREATLDGFEIDRFIGTLEMNLLTKNPVRWYHSFGIEYLGNELYTIHKRTNT